MKRLLVLLAAIMLTFIGAAPAWADNPHLIGSPKASVSGNTLTVTASIAGLGTADTATFNLSGTVDVFSRCYNKGGNKPQADNKQETISVDSTATFPVRNGRTNATFTISPLSTLHCPGKQVVVIEDFSYDLLLSGEGLTPVPIQG